MVKRGIDVSVWQAWTAADWQRAKADGREFTFIKAGEAGRVDTRFATHWANAVAAGFQRGAYIYYRHATDPGLQARQIVSAVGGMNELPLVVDVEETGVVSAGKLLLSAAGGYDHEAHAGWDVGDIDTPDDVPVEWKARAVVGITRQAYGERLHACLQEIQKLTGQAPMVYTSRSAWARLVGNVSWARDYPLWVAQYPQPVPTAAQLETMQPLLPEGWADWRYWQYAVSTIDGIAGQVDMNVTRETPAPATGKVKLGAHGLYEVPDTAALSKYSTVVKLCHNFDALPYLPADTLIIGRPEEQFLGDAHHVGEGDPFVLGAEFAQTIYAPLIAAYPRIDVWEGPNEVNPDNATQMNWYAAFLAEFARQISLMGKRAAIGSFATGCPELELWPYYAPALQACRDFGAFHARHCYGPLNEWHALRYRQDQAAFNKLGYAPQVLITECGEDAPDQPWRVKFGGNINAYWEQWIEPFILELNKDPYVKGATIFTVGNGYAKQWSNFDISGEGVPQIIQAKLGEIAMPASGVLFQCRANPIVGGYCTLHPAPDQPANGRRDIGYVVDVFAVKITASGVWLQVTPDGRMWMRSSDLLTL